MKSIEKVDFSNIKNKLIHTYGWPKKNADKCIQQYKNFLFLLKKYGNTQQLTPSEDLDEVWHLHILNTKQYRQDCDNIFGKFLDHDPIYPTQKSLSETSKNTFQITQDLYRKEFGVFMYNCIPNRLQKISAKIFKF